MFLSPESILTLDVCGNDVTFSPFKIFISVLMVFTGSINTLSVKGADMMEATNSAGEYVEFNHPFFQANVMMLGEMLCMVAYVAYWLCGGVKNNESPEGKPNMFLFLPPALCDVTATSMMYIGLTMTSASQFQMLRGSIMIFVGLLSIVFLKKKLEWFRWAGMAVVFAGILMVGGADFMKTGEGDTFDTNAVIGDIIIVCAQLIAACQFVWEEKYIAKYNVHPLKVVGSEGIFGFLTLAALQYPLYLIQIDGLEIGNNPDGRLEDAGDAFAQMNNEPRLYGILSLTVISIAFFNFSGVSITKYMSATTRKVLDTLRTMVIWACSMLFHLIEPKWTMPTWKQFGLQLAGFVLVVTGIFLYSDVLIRPYFIKRRMKKKEKESNMMST